MTGGPVSDIFRTNVRFSFILRRSAISLHRSKTGPAIRRHNNYEKRLSSILKAASKVIAKKGFDGASVRQVATKGKIGLSGLYYYFENKDELLYAIQQHAFSTLVRLLKERLEKAASPEERLKAVIDNHFQFFVANLDEFKVCVHEMESLSYVPQVPLNERSAVTGWLGSTSITAAAYSLHTLPPSDQV